MERHGVHTSDSIAPYLVGLLTEFVNVRITDEPLSLLLVGKGQETPGERVRVLKEVGDTSLYVTGFFADSLEKKLVDADYYMGIGTSAYSQLARHLHKSKSIRIVYEELAQQFPRFVDVLSDVRSQVNVASSDLVSMYRQWQQTRSQWIERRLRTLGVLVPGGSSGDDYIH